MQDSPASASSEIELTRREFVATTLSAGIALAASPSSAQTVTANPNGMVAGDVKIPVPEGEISGYRARPESGGPFPVVIRNY